MSKFLYPIYKLNIESYKKWWLYHKKAGGSGILSEILQGFSFNLENTLNRKFKLFEIEGNSVQDGTPSPDNEVPIYSAGDNENLFDKDNEEQFLQNLTPDNNGLIVSAQTSTTSPNYIRTIIIPCKSDANYAITRFLGGKTFFIYESDEYPTLNKQTTLLKRNNDTGKVSEIIKTSATAKYLLVKIYNTYASEYYSYDELISSIKIEKGTVASSWSPYGMGSINEKISNKNLLPNEIEDQTINGITVKKDDDGGYIFNGTASKGTFFYMFSNQNLRIPAGTYIQSVHKSGTVSGNSYFEMRDINGDTISRGALNIYNTESKSITLTEDVYVKQSTIYFGQGRVLNNFKIYPMLEPGSTATDYVPHEEQDYSIFVQQPMRSIGDVRDCFVKKSDGKKYERHWIGEVVLNGSENWGLAERSETSNGVFYIENFLNTYGLIREQCLSNYGTYITGYSDRVGQFDIHYSQLRFYAYNNTATINDWKNKLTEKNLVINGFLAEPLDLPCTPEQIQQLENKPSTYKDFTIIQSQDETPAHLKIQYWKEVQS